MAGIRSIFNKVVKVDLTTLIDKTEVMQVAIVEQTKTIINYLHHLPAIAVATLGTLKISALILRPSKIKNFDYESL